jgi:O-acetyl-ADP-ribose deacetylase (regulator of RNase III)
MISYTKGNLLDAPVDALVNTVNTVGVMGKGIALAFKKAFPENFREYEIACKKNEVVVEEMFVTKERGKWIINFPTKQHWKDPSKLEWIEQGLEDLKRVIIQNEIKSVAIPKLGCGSGGLDWNEVKPLIEKALGSLTDVSIIIYEN